MLTLLSAFANEVAANQQRCRRPAAHAEEILCWALAPARASAANATWRSRARRRGEGFRRYALPPRVAPPLGAAQPRELLVEGRHRFGSRLHRWHNEQHCGRPGALGGLAARAAMAAVGATATGADAPQVFNRFMEQDRTF